MIFILWAKPTLAGNADEKNTLSQFNLPEMHQSPAYQDLMRHPITELSKINYLIERFKDANAEIDYNGHYYYPKDISRFVQMFIAIHFDPHETAKDWIIKYANRSIPKGDPIWIRLSNGKFYQSKDVLMGELDDLENVLSKRQG